MEQREDGPFCELPPKRSGLLEGGISRSVWTLAAPLIVGNVLQNTFNIVDLYFVGRLGPEAVAAVALAGVLIGLIFTVAVGLAIGTIALVSQNVGAGNPEEANKVNSASFHLALLLTAATMLFGWFCAGGAIRFLGAADAAAEMGTRYFRIVSLGSFTIYAMIALSSSLRGAGDANTPMKVLALANVVNIVLDPLLIFGLAGFPRMGVTGSATATVISRAIGIALLIYLMARGNLPIRFNPWNLVPDAARMLRIARLGVFGSLELGLRELASLALIRIVAQYGTGAVAAYGIVMRLRLVILMPGIGLSIAAATLVGQNLGARQPARAGKSAWACTGYYEVLLLAFTALIFLVPGGIIGVFSADGEVVRHGAEYIRYFAASLFLFGPGIVISRALNGAGDTVSPMVITALTKFGAQIALAYALSGPAGMGTTGIWLAVALGNCTHGIIISLWFATGRWTRLNLLGETPRVDLIN